MDSKRLLLISSSRSGSGGFLEAAKNAIHSFPGDKKLTIAFIPFASVQKDHEAYAQMVSDALRELPYSVKVVLPDNATAVIETADVIMTGGGNTFKLLHDLYEYKLIELIRRRVQEGVPYIGWSAGSNIAAPTICTTNDMPVTEPESFRALDLVPFQINPHYYNMPVAGFNGETRDQRLTEFLLLNKNVPVVGLPEGSMLTLDKGQLIYSGESTGKLFEGVNEKRELMTREIADGADVSFLLK